MTIDYPAYIFTAVDPISKLLFMRAYHYLNSLNGKDFLARLAHLDDEDLSYIQADNGSEFAKHFEAEAEQTDTHLLPTTPKLPKMSCYVKRPAIPSQTST